MSRFAALLRLPRWIERAWQETRIDEPVDSEMPTFIHEETIPAELLATPDVKF